MALEVVVMTTYDTDSYDKAVKLTIVFFIPPATKLGGGYIGIHPVCPSNKRENYKFEIVNYPDLSGNIPHGASYSVYTSQVIRYARVCNNADDFKERVKVLTNKLIKKGFTINRLKNTMKKCLGKHSWIAKKYKGLVMQNLY